jgi:hypothetical protein
MTSPEWSNHLGEWNGLTWMKSGVVPCSLLARHAICLASGSSFLDGSDVVQQCFWFKYIIA